MDDEWLHSMGNDLLFKVHGKMFAITALEPAALCWVFERSDETFAELTERPKPHSRPRFTPGQNG